MKFVILTVLIVILAGCRDTKTPQQQRDGQIEARPLPLDLCWVDGKPKIPELDYIGYGSPHGLVLKYINFDGDLVILIEDKPIGVYEGDFCR